MRKRQIVAATYYSTPPPQSRKYNYVFTSTEANGASQYERVNTLNTSAWGSAAGGNSWTSMCCSGAGRAVGVFTSVNTPGSLRVRDLNLAMSYRATV